jgi:uroporphyrin-III C-methyltransferase / precorrin-2 dehydrogenase / sirohydrochlorin ferrochelatase
MTAGFVSLVGAGPGHPDHLTLRAARRLRDANVVLHDALVSSEVLAVARKARLVDVGKRGGGAQVPQAEIHRLLIANARAGRRVVRLKGGDPFVFGRGGEEAEALIDAGIPFEVVPGITTAVAAPALSGIPVTHRGRSHGFIVLTGAPFGALDETLAGLLPQRMTLVILMAMQVRAPIAAALLGRGWRGDTPCAVVVGASDDSWTWRGTLDELPSVVVPRAHADRPGTIVVGAVAALPIPLVDGVWRGASDAGEEFFEGAVHAVAR